MKMSRQDDDAAATIFADSCHEWRCYGCLLPAADADASYALPLRCYAMMLMPAIATGFSPCRALPLSCRLPMRFFAADAADAAAAMDAATLLRR